MTKQKLLYIFTACMIMAAGTACKKDSHFAHSSGAAMTIENFTPTQGGKGTEILVTGSNFTQDTSKVTVIINGHKLAIVGVSATQVMAVVPRKCGSGHIIVKIGTDSVVSSGIYNYTFTRTVSTLAGSGTEGFLNAQGTDAKFDFTSQMWYRSSGVVTDDKLNVYVADPGNHCIRKIDSAGNVTTFAGDPANSGYQDGKGSAAMFSLPYDLAIDAAGNIYCVDPGNWDIRKIAPDGTAVTIAWGWQAPWSVAIDKTTGYLYYSSCDPSGNVYQVNSSFATTQVISGLNYPAGLGFDKAGNLYVSINGENVVRKFAAGNWANTVIAGQLNVSGYQNGIGTAAKFATPWGLALDADDNIYLAGNGTWDGSKTNPDQSIRLIKAGTWDVSTFAGSGTAGYTDAIGEAAAFSAPGGVTVDKNGTAYVLDKNNNRIRKIVSE